MRAGVGRQRKIPAMGRDERLRFFCKVKLPERFLDCWIWDGPASTGRYGMFRLFGTKYLPHRVMYAVCWGDYDPGLCVCHRCDNPRCVNPNHLFLGTHTDNMQDMLAKGRRVTVSVRGERVGSSKLTGEQVLAIRADDRMQRHIAAEYGVAQSVISRIKGRVTWAHL